MRIKAIETDDFEWVFSAFGAHQPLNAVSPKVLRALLRRSYDLVRHDIPRKMVEADFEMLERAVKTESSFAKLFRITTISNASSNTTQYPYTLTFLAEKVTGKKGTNWTIAQKYLDRILADKKIDLKKSDNRYHWRRGRATSRSRISIRTDLLDLIKRIKNGEGYELEL